MWVWVRVRVWVWVWVEVWMGENGRLWQPGGWGWKYDCNLCLHTMDVSMNDKSSRGVGTGHAGGTHALSWVL